MKGDKAQTRPERRTPPLRETHEGRQGTDETGRVVVVAAAAASAVVVVVVVV